MRSCLTPNLKETAVKIKHLMLGMSRAVSVVHDAIKEDLIEHFRVTYPTFAADTLDFAEQLKNQLPSLIQTDGMSDAEINRRVRSIVEGLEAYIQLHFDVDAAFVDDLRARTSTLSEIADAIFDHYLESLKRG